MAWGETIAAGAMSLLGVGAGGAISLITQRKQRKADDEKFTQEQADIRDAERHQRGRQRAAEMLDRLKILRDDYPYSVGWNAGNDAARDKRCDEALEQFWRLVLV